MPFEVAVDGRRGWVCATPHADSTDDLCAPVWGVDLNGDADWVPFVDYHGPYDADHTRVLRLWDTREEAVRGAWSHAETWWRGEPPDVRAVTQHARRLPDGYHIFIEADPQRRMWLVRPDGTVLGETSGTSLSQALDLYQKDAWREVGDRQHEKNRQEERDRIRAWTDNEPPRKWVVLYDDDGCYRAPMPEEHCAEMRIYMPRAMVSDIRRILRHCDVKQMGVHAHLHEWINEALRRHAVEAHAKMTEDQD